MNSPPNSPRWSPSFDKPFTIEFRASPVLIAMLIVMHSGAVGALILTPMSWILRLALAAVTLVSCVYSLRVHGLRRGERTVLFLHDNDGVCTIKTRAARQVVSIETQFVHPLAVVLRLRGLEDKSAYALVVVYDAADPDRFQHWRARLNTRALDSSATDSKLTRNQNASKRGEQA